MQLVVVQAGCQYAMSLLHSILHTHSAHPLSGLRTCICVICAVKSHAQRIWHARSLRARPILKSYKAGTATECSSVLQAIRFVLYDPAICNVLSPTTFAASEDIWYRTCISIECYI